MALVGRLSLVSRQWDGAIPLACPGGRENTDRRQQVVQ